MRSSEQALVIADRVVPVRGRWAEQIRASYPDRVKGKSRPKGGSWPWFDNAVTEDRRKHAEHLAKRVGAGLSGVVAGAAAQPVSWNVIGQANGELGGVRSAMWCLVQTVAGFEQVALGLFEKGPNGWAAVAECLPNEAGWPGLRDIELVELRILRKDFRDLAEPGLIKRDGDFAIASIRNNAAPSNNRDRIRVARGLRHLIAHGVLSPSKVQKLGLIAWINRGIDDLAIAAVAAAEKAIRTVS